MKPIPEAALQQHTAILGKTGAGKSSTAKLAIEQVYAEGERVCVLDPIKSDWWGLTSSADGKRPGLPFHILGGPRGHVALHSSAGKAIAELVAGGALPHSIIDMADFEPGGQSRFFVDFAPALLRRMRGVLYLVIEEAHLFAPKERSGIGAENMSIHWAKTLATSGRSKGIRLIVLSQRTQALHNALLGSCDTLIAHRFTAPADQGPVNKWLKANVNAEIAREVAESLSSLKTGEGWICAGEAKVFARRQFPRIHTFDNTATPTSDGEVRDVKQAPVDQEKLRSIIGEAVKEAEANDPKLLRAEIARLKAEAAKKPAAAPAKGTPVGPRREDLATINALRKALEAAMKFIIEINAKGFFKAGGEAVDRAEIEKAISGAAQSVQKLIERHLDQHRREVDGLRRQGERVVQSLQALLEDDVTIKVDVRHQEPFTVSHVAPVPRAARPPAGDSGIPGPQQRVLDALTWWASIGVETPDKGQVGFLAGYRVGKNVGGTFGNLLGALRGSGLIEYPSPGNARLTAEGQKLARPPQEAPSTEALQRAIFDRLDNTEARVLQAIIDTYPQKLTKQDAGARSGYTVGENVGGTFGNILGRLRSLGLIGYPRPGEVVALPVLFLE